MVQFSIFKQHGITPSIDVIYILCGHNTDRLLSPLDLGEMCRSAQVSKAP